MGQAAAANRAGSAAGPHVAPATAPATGSGILELADSNGDSNRSRQGLAPYRSAAGHLTRTIGDILPYVRPERQRVWEAEEITAESAHGCDHLNWPRFGPSVVANFGPAWVVISPDGWAGVSSRILGQPWI